MQHNQQEGGLHRLFIANVSKQVQVVCYRLDYSKDGELKDANRRYVGHKQQDIPAGQQRMIGGQFHIMQITEIVDQLSPYGLVGVVDVPRLPNKVVPYVYSIDKPVPAAIMEKLKAFNMGIQIEDGRVRRQKAAIVTNEMVQSTVAQQFLEVGIPDAPSDKMSVAFEQEEQTEAGEKLIEEGYRVDASAAAPAAPRKRGRPRKT